MKIDAMDYRIQDVANACKTFIEESSYQITYNEKRTYMSLYNALRDPEAEILVSYSGDVFNGFAIVQLDNGFHDEYFGYLSKFYVLPGRRRTEAGFLLAQESVEWFDSNKCVTSFATATAEVGRNGGFIKLMNRVGYEVNDTGILIRNRYE